MSLFSYSFKTVLFAMIALGSSAPVLGASAPPEVKFEVSPEWLNTHRNDAQLRILDLRTEDEYRLGHIEGAVNLPVERLFSTDKGKQYIASLNHIRTAFSGAGVDSSILAVVYDAGELVKSTRAFWVLEVYGHTRVVVLDGGYKGWTEKHLPVSTKDTIPPPRAFVPMVTPNRLATKLTTRLAMSQPNTVIVDVRDRDQYTGTSSVAARAGHIPNAVSIPSTDVFDQSDGITHIKPIDQLKTLYKSIDRNKSVITYCNDGVRASAIYFSLRRLGYNVANYDGAWLEWGNDMSLPIVAPESETPVEPLNH